MFLPPFPQGPQADAARACDASSPPGGVPVALTDVLPRAELFGAVGSQVARLSTDSRTLRPGDWFVALKGPRHDGHDFVDEAVRRGARGIVAERPLKSCPRPVCYVDDTRDAFGRLAHALAGFPCRRLRAIGVAGTHGKATTSLLVASVLAEAGLKAGWLTGVGRFDGRSNEIAAEPNPPADRLAAALARMAASECTHAVLDLSAAALVERRTAGLELDTVCMTHADPAPRGGSQAHGVRGTAWARAFEALRPEGLAVLNVDCRHAARLVERLDGPVLTVSVGEAAEITALSIESLDCEQTFLLTAGDDTLPVRTALVGPHQVTNCLLAAAVGLGYGLDLPTIVRGLEAVPGVPGRLERIEAGQPFRVFLDAARSPAALATALDTLRLVTSGRLICVCSAASSDAPASHAALHAALESAADVAIVTAAANTAEALATTFAGPSVAGGLAGGVRVIEDRQAAIAAALAEAGPGDCVLVAGGGVSADAGSAAAASLVQDRRMVRDWFARHCRPRVILGSVSLS